MKDIATKSAPNAKDQITDIVGGSLQDYLVAWDADYKESISKIDIFNPSVTAQYSNDQIKYFIKIFYHSRGHFKDFLWHLGNYAPNVDLKKIILKNIEEEFNGNYISHEQMYLDFAKQMDVDLTDVILNEDNYLPEIREFNNAHVKWLFRQPWDVQFAAFSAYERLDKTDYEALTAIFPKEHIFFKVHREAEHFDKTYNELSKIWDREAKNVNKAFDFIYVTQAKMWKDLSIAISKV
ncbi:MAG: iron-containing redox enzyme family protein [Coxiellaceae bacterium]|nr:iron-containing redox enzyme family protein [Coxiellaceae bacterium]